MKIGFFAACAHSLSIWLSFQDFTIVIILHMHRTVTKKWTFTVADSGVGFQAATTNLRSIQEGSTLEKNTLGQA